MLQLPTFAELADYVRRVLADHACLDDKVPFMDSVVTRRGDPVGLEFLLLANRTLRLSAVWDALGERILFYDQDLVRFRIDAAKGPPLAAIHERPRLDLTLRTAFTGK